MKIDKEFSKKIAQLELFRRKLDTFKIDTDPIRFKTAITTSFEIPPPPSSPEPVLSDEDQVQSRMGMFKM